MKYLVDNLVRCFRKRDKWIIFVEKFFGADIATMCERRDDEMHVVTVKAYKDHKNSMVDIRKNIREWLESLSPEEKQEAERQREQYLDSRKDELFKLFCENVKNKNIVQAEKYQKALLKFEKQDINDFDIEKARNYPIEKIIPVKNNFSLCLNHDDEKPSMYIKNNYVYCFSCGYTADAIGVYMKVNNVSFKQAIKLMV